MAVEDADDFASFVDADEFGSEVLINDQPFSAIVDSEDMLEGDVLVLRTVLTMSTDDTAGLSKDDPVVINSKNYKYKYQRDDGTGMSKVVVKDNDG